jgi:hypothetical protein
MDKANMSFDDFKNVLADLFGQPLNQKAEVAAQDFWKNVSDISEGVSQGNIGINVDILALARAFPEYKRYQVWKGLSIIVFLVALVVLIFSWKFAIVIVVAGVVFHIIGNVQRRASGQKFISGLREAVTAGDVSKGIGNLCAQYIAGNIQLSSNLGRAHWPQLPSDVLNGQQNFI